MRNRLIIRDKDKTVIDETNVYDTLVAIGRRIGFKSILATGVDAKKGRFNYRLLRRFTNSDCYKLHSNGWYVLFNVPVISAAIALNELFETLNLRLIVCVIDR